MGIVAAGGPGRDLTGDVVFDPDRVLVEALVYVALVVGVAGNQRFIGGEEDVFAVTRNPGVGSGVGDRRSGLHQVSDEREQGERGSRG